MPTVTGDPPSPRPSSWVRRYWRWGVVAAYMGVIFGLSSLSGVSIPGQISDKTAHASVYSVLSACIVWALVDGRWRRVTFLTVLLATVASFLYGWSDEFHQLFVPTRHFDYMDMLADATGAFVAAGVLWAWGIILRGSARTHDV